MRPDDRSRPGASRPRHSGPCPETAHHRTERGGGGGPPPGRSGHLRRAPPAPPTFNLGDGVDAAITAQELQDLLLILQLRRAQQPPGDLRRELVLAWNSSPRVGASNPSPDLTSTAPTISQVLPQLASSPSTPIVPPKSHRVRHRPSSHHSCSRPSSLRPVSASSS
jgi:hypothetical protein